MNVKLTWTDRNTNETGHRIYRSSSPMDTQALPPPVAELGPDVTEWEDTDTPVDQVVYYIVSAVRGDEEAFSDEVMIDTTPLPTVIGQPYGGGFYAGDIEYPDGQWYKLIVADKSAEIYGLQWGGRGESIDTVDYDGVFNTDLMVSSDTSHPAAQYCDSFAGGNSNDWYMPGRNEITVLYSNLGPNQPNCPDDFKPGGTQAFHTSQFYWSSTQADPSQGWSRRFDNGTELNNFKDRTTIRTRPIRRLPFTP